jgi:hypothetical protein
MRLYPPSSPLRDREDRVPDCLYRHGGACTACGFNGVHRTSVEQLEARQYRARCTCSWHGPIRRFPVRPFTVELCARLDGQIHVLADMTAPDDTAGD